MNDSYQYSENIPEQYPYQYQSKRMPVSDPLEEEKSGPYFSLELEIRPYVFEEYEMWAFIEDKIKLPLYDMSSFRNRDGTMMGIIVGQFEEPVTETRLQRIEGARFHNENTVHARLFLTKGDFKKYCRRFAEERIKEANIDTSTTIPAVYLLNFPEEDEKIAKKFFTRCGTISNIQKVPTRTGFYYILFFSNIASATLACRTFDGFAFKDHSLTVAPLYKNAAERTFAVHNVKNPDWVRKQIENFGSIQSFEMITRDVAFVMMEKLEAAKGACILLNHRIDGDSQLRTNFIDTEYFHRKNLNY